MRRSICAPTFGSKLLATLGGVATVAMASPAFAQAAAPAGQPPAYISFLPIVVLFGVMYFMVMRPQAKKQKTHLEFLTALKRGDEVVTSSGLLGRIEGLTDLFVTLEIAPSVRIKILRNQIASFVPAPTAAVEVKA